MTMMMMTMLLMMMMLPGVSELPEQPAAAVSDAGREVTVRLLGARAGSASSRRAGSSDAEGA